MKGIRGEVYDACGGFLSTRITDFEHTYVRFLNLSHVNLVGSLTESLKESLGVLGPSVSHGTKGVCIENRWDV